MTGFVRRPLPAAKAMLASAARADNPTDCPEAPAILVIGTTPLAESPYHWSANRPTSRAHPEMKRHHVLAHARAIRCAYLRAASGY